MNKPLVSIVMGVRNEASTIERSFQSIRGQTLDDWELIIVDDGSEDNTFEILEELRLTEPRARLVRQKHAGLTRALRKGCQMATGTWVARHDAGDVSHAKRLERQVDVVEQHKNVALVSCWTVMRGPAGEFLYENRRKSEDCSNSFLGLNGKLEGPTHHGTALFSRSLYEEVGGYRDAFYFTQDLDLWLRLVERGTFLVVPEVLYETRMAPGTITGLFRSEQDRLKELAIRLARQRQNGGEELATLKEAGEIRPGVPSTGWRRKRRAATLYFIGESLRRRGDRRACGYLREAAHLSPLDARIWVRLLQANLPRS